MQKREINAQIEGMNEARLRMCLWYSMDWNEKQYQIAMGKWAANKKNNNNNNNNHRLGGSNETNNSKYDHI